MRTVSPASPAPDPQEAATQRQALQEALAAGKLSLSAFGRAWRALERPKPLPATPPDEIGFRRARKLLAEFGTLWRDPAVPDRLREEALLEIFTRVDVDGAQVVAVHPRENQNAWLLGYHARKGTGVVGARGVEPSLSKWRSGSRPRITQGWCSPHPRQYELRRRPRQDTGTAMQSIVRIPIAGRGEWEAAALKSA